jgi:opacity protein-like surface antigen
MGGWIGYFKSNSYASFAAFNPYIWAPNFINNNRVEEIFGGVKGALTDHFSYNVKAGYHTFSNHPLFKNDTASGKSFAVINKPRLKALNFNGEIGYNVGEKFSLRSRLELNRYLDLEEFDRAWGLLPMEFTTTLRLQVIKDLFVKGDLFAFEGGPFQTRLDGTGRTKGAMDLSAGLEFAVVKNVKLWAQFNNLLGSEYQRWKQYPTYGFNFLGGVVFSFAKTNKIP